MTSCQWLIARGRPRDTRCGSGPSSPPGLDRQTMMGRTPVTVCCGKMDKNGPSNVMIDLLEIAVFHSYVKNYKRVNHDVTSRKDGFTSLTSQNGT